MARRILYALVGLVVCLAAAWLIVNRQLLADRWQLRHYQPSAEISALADSLDLTDYGRRLFFVKDPQIHPAFDFNRSCPERESSSLVLGCYDGSQIHLFLVSDERLEGVEEVTAAHELLHVAYERLAEAERAELKIWLKGVKNGLTNQRIQKAISLYASLGDEQLYNELHSIFATEVRQLPDGLNNHYAQYFNNRLAIVELSEAYDDTFSQLESKVAELDEQLAKKANKIEVDKISLADRTARIDARREVLQQLLNRGDNQKYNAEVDSFSQSIDAYFNASNQLQADIDSYNQLIEERNALSHQQNELLDSLDSLNQAPVEELAR